MNLEKEFEEIIENHTTYIGKECKISDYNIGNLSKQCSELSQDIAIKFAIFLRDWEYVDSHTHWYKGLAFVQSEEELFQLFIEQHYE